jgi:hypothetical protein
MEWNVRKGMIMKWNSVEWTWHETNWNEILRDECESLSEIEVADDADLLNPL